MNRLKNLQNQKTNRTLIASTQEEYLAHLYVGKLSSHGIQSQILNQKDSMYQAWGGYEIYVHPKDAVKAKYILDQQDE